MGVWDREHGALTLGLVLTVAFGAFEALAVATVLPITVKEIGGLELYGWSFSAFMLANLVGISATGRATDRRGPAPAFAASVALFVAGLTASGLAPSMHVLVAGRVVQGLGAGGISAVAYAAVAAAYPVAARPRMLALLASAWVVPGLVGPALAGLVAERIGWRVVFLALVPATVLGAAVALPALRRVPRTGEHAAGAPGTAVATLLLALGVGAALVGVELTDPWQAMAVVAVGLTVAGPALARLLPPGTLRAAPGAPAAIAVASLLGLGFFGAEAFVPLALTDVRGQSAILAGLPLTAATLAWTSGTWIQAREASRRSRRALVATGLVLLALGVAAVTTILSPRVPTATAIVAWGLAALGMGIAHATTSLVILESAPAGQEGERAAAFQLAFSVGIAVGTGAGGAILNAATASGRSLAIGIALVDAMALAALLLALAAVRRVPHRALAPAPARDAAA